MFVIVIISWTNENGMLRHAFQNLAGRKILWFALPFLIALVKLIFNALLASLRYEGLQ